MPLTTTLAGRSGVFFPLGLPGLKVWLMADAITGLSDGDPVTTWVDQSGNGNSPTNAVVAEKPTYEINEIHGRPIVRFDGINDSLAVTYGVALAQPNHIFIVGKQVTWASNDTIFDGVTNNVQRIFQTIATPSVRMYAGALGPPSASWTLNTAMLLECLYNGANSTFIVNAGAAAGGDPGAGAMDGLVLAENGAGTNNGHVDIAEFLVYDQEVSGADLTKLRSYFTRRWAVP